MKILSPTVLVSRVSADKFDPDALSVLVRTYLLSSNGENARVIADAILRALPLHSPGAGELYPRLRRFGARWAYGVVRCSMPPDDLRMRNIPVLRAAYRLAWRIHALLREEGGTGHLTAVKIFVRRIGLFAHVVRTVDSLGGDEGNYSGLRGVLFQDLMVALVSEEDLTSRWLRRYFRHAPKARDQIVKRAQETVPAAIANPLSVRLTPGDFRRRQDILLDHTLESAPADELFDVFCELELEPNGVVLRADGPPQFLEALLRNPHFLSRAGMFPQRLASIT